MRQVFILKILLLFFSNILYFIYFLLKNNLKFSHIFKVCARVLKVHAKNIFTLIYRGFSVIISLKYEYLV